MKNTEIEANKRNYREKQPQNQVAVPRKSEKKEYSRAFMSPTLQSSDRLMIDIAVILTAREAELHGAKIAFRRKCQVAR